jgi:glycosyltransferase involved in cell wall biosynthesis
LRNEIDDIRGIQRPKRILQIGPYPPPGTGWSVRIKMLKRYLERAGHTCVALNTNKNRRQKSEEFVPVHNGFDYARKVFKFCAQGFLVHMHLNGKSTKSPILALAAEIICLFFGRRIVLTFHAGAVQDYFPRQGKLRIDLPFRLIFLLAKKIICNNEAVKARIVEYGIRPEKIMPIPAFCPQYLEDKNELPAAIKNFVETHQPVASSYIYLRPDFNIDFLLRGLRGVLQQCPRLGLIFMGAFQETPKLNQLLHEHGLAENSFVASDLDHGDFLAVLAASGVYIRTPVVDGVSSSVLEAVALGTRVVASENGSRPPDVMTYQDGNVTDFVEKVRAACSTHGVGDNAPSLRRGTEIRDTLKEEIALLIQEAP